MQLDNKSSSICSTRAGNLARAISACTRIRFQNRFRSTTGWPGTSPGKRKRQPLCQSVSHGPSGADVGITIPQCFMRSSFQGPQAHGDDGLLVCAMGWAFMQTPWKGRAKPFVRLPKTTSELAPGLAENRRRPIQASYVSGQPRCSSQGRHCRRAVGQKPEPVGRRFDRPGGKISCRNFKRLRSYGRRDCAGSRVEAGRALKDDRPKNLV